MKIKFLSANEAVKQIKSGTTVATDGFVGAAFPEELALELEKRFIETGDPQDLTLVYCAGQLVPDVCPLWVDHQEITAIIKSKILFS